VTGGPANAGGGSGTVTGGPANTGGGSGAATSDPPGTGSSGLTPAQRAAAMATLGANTGTVTDNGDGTVTTVITPMSLVDSSGTPASAARITVTGTPIRDAGGAVIGIETPRSIRIDAGSYSHQFDVSDPYNRQNNFGNNLPLIFAGDGAAVGTVLRNNLVTSMPNSPELTSVPGFNVPGILHYGSFGAWASVDSAGAPVSMGAFAGGNETPIAALPTQGSAVYSGTAAGYLNTGHDTLGLVGTADVTVNFASGAVGGTIATSAVRNNVGVITSTSWNEVRLDGNLLSGSSRFVANATTTNTTALSPTVMSGPSSGAIVGPAANELVGTAKLTGGGQAAVLGFGGAQR
jgi:hypothetical protein